MSQSSVGQVIVYLPFKAPNIAIAKFANTVDPDEMAHYDLQCFAL